MAVNQQHTREELVTGDSQLPLYDFFISLRQHGFLVTPAQIADSHTVIAQYAGLVATEADLCDYLSPLFANSEEDQLKFKEIFDHHFNPPAVVVVNNDNKKGSIKKHLKKHAWKYITGIALIIAGFIFLWDNDPVKKTEQINLRTNYRGNDHLYYEAIQISTNEKIQAYVETNDRNRDSIYGIRLLASYDWGDNSYIDSSAEHRFTLKGIYQMKAFVRVYYGSKFRYTDTLQQTVKVCDENNSLFIDQAPNRDSAKLREPVQFRASVTGKVPDSIKWYDGNRWLHTGNILDTSFNSDGYRQFTAIAIYDSAGSPCSVHQNVNLVVYDPEKPLMSVSVFKSANANPVTLHWKVKPGWFFFAGAILLLSFMYMLFSEKNKRKARKKTAVQLDETDRKYTELVKGFNGKKPPFDLPFLPKNGLPLPEPAMNEVAWQMRRRIDDESTYLHLPKTIQRSVRNAGFFQPVKFPRTYQSEWLVLVDETTVNNQQVKLFDWLVEWLRKQNVLIDQFYYRQQPGLCYNVFEPAGISLEKLQEKFHGHILLILGNASQFIYANYPIFDPGYLQIIRRWKYKAILTPVPVPDWGYKEKNVLAAELPVLPADVFGLFLMIQHLFSNDEISVADFNEFRDQFYKVAPVDFEDTAQLKSYCENASWAKMPPGDSTANILFQWIAALAVYPRIRWEIIVAIGKAITEKYGKPAELNFTNLLRISRIKWMGEGRFPDYTRLDLLKELTVDNEILARETILALLYEIPEHEIGADHFVYEEKEIQRVINEFNLYAYDPKIYAPYEGSREIFERLWKEKKILDAPAKVYLKNEGGKWNTLVNRADDKNGVAPVKANVPLEEYFDEPPAQKPGVKNLRVWAGFIISILFLGSLLGLIFLTILNFIDTNYFTNLTYKKQVQRDVTFTFKDSSNKKVNHQAVLNIDTTELALVKDSAVSIILPFDDSAKIIDISVNGEQLFNSLMHFDQDAYTVILKETTPDNNIKATIYLGKFCTQGINDYKSFISTAYKNIQITDSVLDIDTYIDSAGCLNRIASGNRVDINIRNQVIDNFRKSGIELLIDPNPLYTVADNELIVYHTNPSAVVVDQKPVIYIQLSDESLRRSALAFKKELESNGYTVASVDIANYNYNSQVSYYNKNLNNQAVKIQQLYKTYYPDLPIPVKLAATRKLNMEGRVDIWIKKLDEGNSLPLRLNSSGTKVAELQDMLIAAGYKYVVQNSVFDRSTEKAVKEFQSGNKMIVDGIVGEKVWSELSKFMDAADYPAANVQQSNSYSDTSKVDLQNSNTLNQKDCKNLYLNIPDGTLNNIRASDNLASIKEYFPCWDGETEEDGGVANYGGGVFYNRYSFYFYTCLDFIEVRKDFKGTVSNDLLNSSFEKVIKIFGEPLKKGKADNNSCIEYIYKMKYGYASFFICKNLVDQIRIYYGDYNIVYKGKYTCK